MLLRNRFFKTCAFNTNIQKYFEDHNITKIEQLNGFTLAKDIKDIKLITTPNSVKYLKFGKATQWLENIDSTFGIVKHEKETHYFNGRMVQCHYQLLNTLQLSYEDMEAILEPSLTYISAVRSDPDVLRYHIGYPFCAEDEDGKLNPLKSKNDIVFKLLGINNKFAIKDLEDKIKNGEPLTLVEEKQLAALKQAQSITQEQLYAQEESTNFAGREAAKAVGDAINKYNNDKKTSKKGILGGSINAIDGTIKCNDLQTKTLKLADGKIGFIDSANKGGYIDLNYNFGASSTKANFIAKITGYTSEREQKWVIFDVIYSYRYTFTVHIGASDNPDTNKILNESQSFVIVYKVMNKEYRITVTIPAGSYQGTGTGEWIESGSSVQSYNFQVNNSKEYTFTTAEHSFIGVIAKHRAV